MASWFGFKTAEKAEKARQENLEKMEQETREMIQQHELEVKELKNKHLTELKEYQRNAESHTASIKNAILDETKMGMEKLQMQSKKHKEILENKARQKRIQSEKDVKMYENSRKLEIAERKERLERSQKEEARLNDLILTEKKKKLQIETEGHGERFQMRETYESKKRERIEAQKSKILELEEKLAEVLKEREVLLGQLEEEHVEKERIHYQKITELEQLRLSTNLELTSALISEDKHEEYRDKCSGIIRSYDRLKDAFNSEEHDIMMAIEQMNYGWEVSNPINFKEISRLTSNFMDKVQRLTVTEQMRNLQQDTIKWSTELKNAILKLGNKFEIVKQDKAKIPEIIQQIRELFETAKQQILRLNGIIQQYNLPPKLVLQETITQKLIQFGIGNTSRSSLTAITSNHEELMEISYGEVQQNRNNQPSEDDIYYILPEE